MKKPVSASLVVGLALSVAACSKSDDAGNAAVANDVAVLNDSDANLTAIDESITLDNSATTNIGDNAAIDGNVADNSVN